MPNAGLREEGQASWVAWEIRVTERREEGRGLRYRVLGGGPHVLSPRTRERRDTYP